MSQSNLGSGFFWKNLFKGLFYAGLIVALYLLAREVIDVDSYMAKLGEWPVLTYLTFSLSELIFGLIPPELFIIWVIEHGVFNSFIPDVALLAVISVAAGIIGYSIGKSFRTWTYMNGFMERYVYRYNSYYRRYGGFLVVIGALTPLPFSAVCMLMGASGYPYGRFLLLTGVRFIRFGMYGWAIWKTVAP